MMESININIQHGETMVTVIEMEGFTIDDVSASAKYGKIIHASNIVIINGKVMKNRYGRKTDD